MSELTRRQQSIGVEFSQPAKSTIESFTWKDVNVTVRDRRSRQPKMILKNISGVVKAGELLALMGPS